MDILTKIKRCHDTTATLTLALKCNKLLLKFWEEALTKEHPTTNTIAYIQNNIAISKDAIENIEKKL